MFDYFDKESIELETNGLYEMHRLFKESFFKRKYPNLFDIKERKKEIILLYGVNIKNHLLINQINT
jgi:hypothetical protein